MAPKTTGQSLDLFIEANLQVESDVLRRCWRIAERSPCRLTAYEFSGNDRANARLLSAATRG